MITKVELRRDGSRYVFHRTESGTYSWTHPEGKPASERPCDCRSTGPGRPPRTPEQEVERARKDRERKRRSRAKIA